jgi:tetrahydromethanopterin S-methyltransferase subunit E
MFEQRSRTTACELGLDSKYQVFDFGAGAQTKQHAKFQIAGELKERGVVDAVVFGATNDEETVGLDGFL